jgi:hypothetical protein
MRHVRLLSFTLLAALLASACYTTKIKSGTPRPGGQWHQDRQWFTLGGLASLSPEAGDECDDGLAVAESRLSGLDILLNVAIVAGSAAVGAAACSQDDAEEYAACVSGASTLGGFLLGSRSVSYQCRASGPSAP